MSYNIQRHFKEIKVETSIDINVKILKILDTNDTTLLENVNLTSADNYSFIMDNDTAYKVVAEDNSSNVEEFILFHYTNLIKNLSKEFKNFLCNIKDISCNQCNQDDLFQLYNYQLSLKTKLLYLQKSLLNFYPSSQVENFNSFVYNALNSGSCKIADYYQKLIKEECDLGYASDKEIYRIFISVYYLGLYFLDSNNPLNLFTEDEEGNSINYFNSLYQIEKVKKCLCSTCLDFEELKEIYEAGLPTFTLPADINNIPTADNVHFNIFSYTTVFERNLFFSLFNDVFNDDITNSIQGIKITTPFSNAILKVNNNNNNFGTTFGGIAFGTKHTLGNDGDVLTQQDLEISKYNINDVQVVANNNQTSLPYDALGFKVYDGEYYSQEYFLFLNLIKEVNTPPSIIDSLTLKLVDNIYITKSQLLDNGLVQDNENDNIDFIKLVSKFDCTVKYKNTSDNYVDLSIGLDVDLKNYNSNENVLKISSSEGLSNFKLAYKDSQGSGVYSNENNANNVLIVSLNKNLEVKIIIILDTSVPSDNTEHLVGLGRIKIPSLANASVTLTNSTEPITNISLAPANNSFYDYFQIPTLPPPGPNEYDIIGKTSFVNDNDFNINIDPDGTTNAINLIGSINIIQQAGSKVLDFYTLDINESDPEYFNYLDGSDGSNPFSNFYDGSNFVDSSIVSVTKENLSQVKAGKSYNFNVKGVIGFAIQGVSAQASNNIEIRDALNNVVTARFDKYYNPSNSMVVFISKITYTPHSITYKFSF